MATCRVCSATLTDNSAEVNGSYGENRSGITLLESQVSKAMGESLCTYHWMQVLEGNDNTAVTSLVNQTGAEIKTAYEAEANTNAFTDAEKSKLAGIATGASATKCKQETRSMTAGTGDVAYTGYGFTPVGLIIMARLSTQAISIGTVEPSRLEHCISIKNSGSIGTPFSVLCRLERTAGNLQSGVLKTWDEDGFTITWTKTGSPTDTAYMQCFAFGA